MKVIEGRKDALIVFPDGRLIAPRTFTIAMSSFKFYNMIDQFRIVQEEINRFKFIIKMKESGIENEKVEDELSSHIRSLFNLNNTVTFEFEFVADIPIDQSGKLAAVISRVKKPNNA